MKTIRFGLIGLVLLLALLALPAGALAAPAVSVSPDAGPRGTVASVRAVGLHPNTAYLVQLARGAGNVNTVRVFEDTATSDAGGALHYQLTVDQEPGAYTVRIVAIGGTIVAMAPYTVVAETERYFPETGYTVRGRFLVYWLSHGLDLGDGGVSFRESLALFGYPISGEFAQRLEDGTTYTVQYFERARFEYHPEHDPPYDILLGQLGRRILATVPDAPTAPVPPSPQRGATHFPQTGHNVAPDFSLFWSRNGGLALFGYPLSEEFTQRLEDGKEYTVQYFDRARFERHPVQEGMPYNVQLGHLGRQILGPGMPQR